MFVLRLLCQWVTSIKVTFLPVYIPNQKETADPERFAKNVRNSMAKAGNFPTTEHSFEDAILMMTASRKHRLPIDVANVEIQKWKSLYNMNLTSMKELLSKFAQQNPKDGKMDLKQFCSYLEVKFALILTNKSYQFVKKRLHYLVYLTMMKRVILTLRCFYY
jgi:hypothetical protein